MKTRTEENTTHNESRLTKELLVSSAQRAGRVAAYEAMKIMGYVVTVKNGWVVKVYADGSEEKLKELDS
jgi:hypothetical protein